MQAGGGREEQSAAYTLLGLNARLRLGRRIGLGLHLANLTNALGLTEGNARTGAFDARPDAGGLLMARPELGRSLRIALSLPWQ